MTLGGLSYAGLWNPLLYYFLSYAGFLFALELSNPDGPRPKNHRRLRWVSVGGFVVFVYGVVMWVQTVIATAAA
ncbi:hypothetical protein [Haloarcula brevis]|uniref:hypothetical protein n=1 Tax=Haloarcula brevis TaxID=3111453 RepID=UPI00300ED68C